MPATQLRLSPDQIEAKTALESAVEEVKQELAAEPDDQKKDALAAELKEKEAKLDTLMVEFEVSTGHLISCHTCKACLMEWVEWPLSHVTCLTDIRVSLLHGAHNRSDLCCSASDDHSRAENGCRESTQRRDRHQAVGTPAPGRGGADGCWRRRVRRPQARRIWCASPAPFSGPICKAVYCNNSLSTR